MKASPEIGAILKCLVCARDKPWGIFSNNTGEAVCIDCRDVRHRAETAERKLDAALAREAALREACVSQGRSTWRCRLCERFSDRMFGEPAKHEPDCILAQPSPGMGMVAVAREWLKALERIADERCCSESTRFGFCDASRIALAALGGQS